MRLLPLLRTVLWAAFLGSPLRGGSSLRHVVYWNSSNPRLLRGDAVVKLGLNDYLDIVCPHYEGPGPPEGPETFALYMVDWPGYESCQAEGPRAYKRWVCSLPFGHVQFSEKIQRFTPFSLGFEFLPGETYYYISVPTPESSGQCLRLQVSVCCKERKSESAHPVGSPGESGARVLPRSPGGGGIPAAYTGGTNSDRQDAALMGEIRGSEVPLAGACPLITG
ncbi:ephrin-A4 isoform X1 [Symphalangus syndactylus]|uniref:ephrin-A4 isoform X1 n=1 Tax=Symphalangus syndactylus TaxID=9590 RepID=UPI003004578D